MYMDKNTMKMLQRMGLKVEEIKAKRVVIETEDGTKLVFDEPQVMKTTMQGQEAYQVIGKPHVEEDIREEDIELVMQKTGATREEAEKALRETNGDIAEAIMKLM
jgi:nascent polypeptide-associated complex subunit alpha